MFRAVTDASVDDAIAAAAAEAPPRLGEPVATLPYGARAVRGVATATERPVYFLTPADSLTRRQQRRRGRRVQVPAIDLIISCVRELVVVAGLLFCCSWIFIRIFG